ncbi:hypothetical protein BROUX41_003596 [Berkeleyomyces rouxiae]
MARRFLTRFRSWTSATSSKSTGDGDAGDATAAEPSLDPPQPGAGADAGAPVASSQASQQSSASARSRRNSLRPNWASHHRPHARVQDPAPAPAAGPLPAPRPKSQPAGDGWVVAAESVFGGSGGSGGGGGAQTTAEAVPGRLVNAGRAAETETEPRPPYDTPPPPSPPTDSHPPTQPNCNHGPTPPSPSPPPPPQLPPPDSAASARAATPATATATAIAASPLPPVGSPAPVSAALETPAVASLPPPPLAAPAPAPAQSTTPPQQPASASPPPPAHPAPPASPTRHAPPASPKPPRTAAARQSIFQGQSYLASSSSAQHAPAAQGRSEADNHSPNLKADPKPASAPGPPCPAAMPPAPDPGVHKVWVKKTDSSATQVVVHEDDLVDSVRDVILRKFANSLGRHFDSADIMLRLHERAPNQVRTLGPEELLWDVIQDAYPNGQHVNEALVISDVSRRLPKMSPRYVERPNEDSDGYFPSAHGGPIVSPRSLSVHAASPSGSSSRRWNKQRDEQRMRRHMQAASPPANKMAPGPEAVPPMTPSGLPPGPQLTGIAAAAAAAAATATPSVSRSRSSFSKSAATPPIPISSKVAGAAIPALSSSSPAASSVSLSISAPASAPIPGACASLSTPTIITTTAPNTSAGTSAPSNLPDSPAAGSSGVSSSASAGLASGGKEALTLKKSILKTGLEKKTEALANDSTASDASKPNDRSADSKAIASNSASGGAASSSSSPAVVAKPGPVPGPAARKPGPRRDRADAPTQQFIPPIRVLIVEDNPINMRLIHTLIGRLKVRREKATNGAEAVKKWREGGYHLILMDLQLPIMSGLEATQEIRRLERVNKITKHGIDFGGGDHSHDEEPRKPGDILENPEMHKGQVIIVALTASSLPSDRRRALAAGCNDFLTKPVNMPYLQQKITEWGCMQALIDFDNWAKWKEMAIVEEERERVNSEKAASAPKQRKKKKELAAAAD